MVVAGVQVLPAVLTLAAIELMAVLLVLWGTGRGE